MSLSLFIRESRVHFQCTNPSKALRIVSVSQIVKESKEHKLSHFIANKAPLYYRNFDKVVDSLRDGYFLGTIHETLKRLPTSSHFQESHFGEITSSIFLEDIVGLKRIYSKLSLNTSENQNGFKMDIVCYVPYTNPVQFIFCEVKSSPKDKDDGLPAGHDKSCYSDIFNSLREYTEEDKKFDLTSIKDNLNIPDEDEKNRIRESLKPYANRLIGYIGIAIIDSSTYSDEEVPILATRKSKKDFDVELLCVENYKQTSADVYKVLEMFKNASSQI